MYSTLTTDDLAKIQATREAADTDAADELEMYIDNIEPLYRQYQAIEANLLRKMARNTYQPMLARKGWRHLVDAAWRAYRKEFGHFPASVATRQHVANEIARAWEDEHTDEYNAMHDRMDTAA
jgi:hypothetical protein